MFIWVLYQIAGAAASARYISLFINYILPGKYLCKGFLLNLPFISMQFNVHRKFTKLLALNYCYRSVAFV